MKSKLDHLVIRNLPPSEKTYVQWDSLQSNFGVRVQPTGKKSFVVLYSFNNKARWFTIGDVALVKLADARKQALNVMHQVVVLRQDPVADRAVDRSKLTFAQVAARYVEEYAKRKNKSWRTAEANVKRHLLPAWADEKADAITRTMVDKLLGSMAAKPALQNTVLANASAIFTWAMRKEIVAVNPCTKIEINKIAERRRVLAASEVPLFWEAFATTADPMAGAMLKVLLLTGQRPGEIVHMRREHIVDGWWQMPGAPKPELDWPGTKNGGDHRVWLPAHVQALLQDLNPDQEKSGYVFQGPRGGKVDKLDATMRTINKALGITATVRPHDLRRTFGTTVTAGGHGRVAMDRILNHTDGGVGSVYDQYDYAPVDKRITEATAARLLALAAGQPIEDNVVHPNFSRVAG